MVVTYSLVTRTVICALMMIIVVKTWNASIGAITRDVDANNMNQVGVLEGVCRFLVFI